MSLPKYLYHGTSSKFLGDIKQRGLLPRNESGKESNWEHAPSNTNAVYLTDCYAWYFAQQAADEGHNPLVLKIDTSMLDEENFVADEDVVEQILRGHDDIEGTMLERTAYYRERIHNYSAEVSLRAMGTVAHLGRIPREAIVAAITTPADKVEEVILSLGFDPIICLANHRFCSDQYRHRTAEMFSDSADPSLFKQEQTAGRVS
jgi:hypothetical protein